MEIIYFCLFTVHCFFWVRVSTSELTDIWSSTCKEVNTLLEIWGNIWFLHFFVIMINSLCLNWNTFQFPTQAIMKIEIIFTRWGPVDWMKWMTIMGYRFTVSLKYFLDSFSSNALVQIFPLKRSKISVYLYLSRKSK